MPTDAQWRDHLLKLIEEGREGIDLYDDYYDGNHRLSYATDKFDEAFGDQFEEFATNWCSLTVDVAAERLEILGFRFGEDEADEEAWAIWQANKMDVKSLKAHTEAIKLGKSFLLVGPPKDADSEPLITVEHPSQCAVVHDEATGDRLAGLKSYVDVPSGDGVCILYLPERIVTWRKSRHVEVLVGLGLELPQNLGPGEWGSPTASIDNPVGEVMLIPLENNPKLLTGGVSDLKPAVALNDAANKFFLDAMTASEFAAFPQRVLTGQQLPRDPITGEVSDAAQLRAAVSRLWAFENPDVKVSNLAAADLGKYVEMVDMAVQHIAAQTRTPPHYLLAKLANISGDALIAAETGLEFRCKRKHLDFGEPHEEAMRLAFKWRAVTRPDFAGSDDDEIRSTMEDAEVIWRHPGKRDPISLSQSLAMKQSIGVPQEILWEEADYSPQQIKRMKKLRDEEMERQQKLLEAQQGGEVAPAATVSDQPDGNMAVGGLPGPEPTEPASPNGKAKAAA
jgi:hypothetical protein